MKVREGAPTFSLGVAATCKSLEPRILDAPSAAPRLLHTHTHTHTHTTHRTQQAHHTRAPHQRRLALPLLRVSAQSTASTRQRDSARPFTMHALASTSGRCCGASASQYAPLSRRPAVRSTLLAIPRPLSSSAAGARRVVARAKVREREREPPAPLFPRGSSATTRSFRSAHPWIECPPRRAARRDRSTLGAHRAGANANAAAVGAIAFFNTLLSPLV